MQQLSGTLSGRIRAGLVVDIMPETSTSKYFVQKSLEEKFLQKEKMIFILRKCRRAKLPDIKSELCYASQINKFCVVVVHAVRMSVALSSSPKSQILLHHFSLTCMMGWDDFTFLVSPKFISEPKGNVC